MKVCSVCKQDKDESEFYKNSSRKDGLQTYCILCSKTRSKIRYKNFSKNDLLKMRSKEKEVRKRNKQFIWDYLRDHPCVDCGEQDPIVLEFDHIRDKYLAISELVRSAVSLVKLEKEISKCEVRCANCHRRKTAKQFNWYKDIILDRSSVG